MSESRLFHRVDEVARRIRRLRAIRASLLIWALLAVLLLAMAVAGDRTAEMMKLFILGAPLAMLIGWIAGRPRTDDRHQAALQVERNFPELDTRLLAAVQQHPSAETSGFSFLQSELFTEVLRHNYQADWAKSVKGIWGLQLLRILAMILCLVPLFTGPWNQKTTEARIADINDQSPATSQQLFELVVEPGDAEVERGASLLVLARFPQALPDEVSLIATKQNGETLSIPMRKSLDDPVFGGRLADVDQDMTYQIVYSDQTSSEFSITTFTYPELLRADADIHFPEFTGLDEKHLDDVRRVSLVEGSKLDLSFALNKDLQSAALIDDEGNRLELIEDGSDSVKRSLTWNAEDPQKYRYKLELIDQQGRVNRTVPEFVFQVLPNHPADLQVVFPKRDVRVSPIEELVLQANASDDYGLLKYGLIYERPDGESEELELGGKAERDERRAMDHTVFVEELDVVPNQLISYYFYADDIGPDGNVRRAFSDIFFSEVRPFEEIFRQAASQSGQQQQQQQQQQGGESGKLVEIQRQIVTASWNLIRSENRPEPTSQFLPGMEVLFESQEQAIGLAEEMMESLEDEVMKQHLQEAIDAMVSASRHFADGIANEKLESLPQGRSAAQAAYRALLRLNSREKQVQQSQAQSSQSQSQQQRMNRQMNSLELKNDRNRYETERQAQRQEQQAEQRETLQVLNRLRELARRQEDLNQKLRELENQLQQTEDPEQREELERQLKRLQEEQQEMLRNLDELRERMSQEENRQRMAEAREQVDQTRERLLQASEALQQNQTSKAIAEGTRAQRELEELKEDFRRENAGQFDEAIRDLRDDVRNLAQEQQEIERMMQPSTESQLDQRPSLRDPEPQEVSREVTEALEAQGDRLGETLDRTRELIQDAENTEPLLSDSLYETLRDLRRYEPEEALRGAAQLQRYGLDEEAREQEQQARQGIERLQRGVENAAERILGDETEALALANEELEDLTRAIESELEQDPNATQQQPGQQQPGQQQPGQQQPGQQQPGQQQPGQQQPGQQQPGQQQPGQQQPGQQQPGQQQPGQQQPGQQQPGQQQPGQQQPGQQQQGQQQQGQQQQGQQQGQQGGQQQGGQQQGGGRRNGGDLATQLGSLFQETGGDEDGGAPRNVSLPLTGDEYVEWSDRMRDVEEMVTTPELRSRVAQIRDEARKVRVDVKRHSKQPDWEMVRTKIYGPLLELQTLVAEELARRDPNERLVPIDRDPVPDKYRSLLDSYYEQLSKADRTATP
ncbi:hypothetical protein AB1L42_11370 [Thalassoglobus sp. JC818]|uniref:hypothetical protein n=1 Tax=Thalassoglobus sp. JC818 TaxID=3232136 RepID=UPI003459B046